jgi:hypothetical protein
MRVAPARILSRHAHDKFANVGVNTGPSRQSRSVRPLACDQLAVPPQDRVRRHDRRHVREHPTAEAVTKAGKSPSFMVIQPQPTTAQLPFESPVLFSEERDHIALFSLKPAEQSRDDQVQRKHAPSLRQWWQLPQAADRAGRSFETFRAEADPGSESLVIDRALLP